MVCGLTDQTPKWYSLILPVAGLTELEFIGQSPRFLLLSVDNPHIFHFSLLFLDELGRVAQSATRLAADACLTSNPGIDPGPVPYFRGETRTCSQTRYRLPTRPDRKICAFSNFCASNNFCACSRFCASRNFCASSHFCAGSNFCASRNICVLFVLLLYVPKSTTMAMARRSAHLITYLLGNFEEAGNQYFIIGARVLDSRPRGRGFEPHRRHCIVPLSKPH